MRGSILESDVPPRQDVALSDKQSDMHRKQNTPNNEFRPESHSQHLPGSSQNFSHQQNRQVSIMDNKYKPMKNELMLKV